MVYNILYTASEKPLRERINFKLLDQDIRAELLNNGINIPYHFTVSTADGREVYRCPSVFLLTACLITAIIAIAIGSSWSAAGTIGVALMGIGMGLGVDPAMTAGAVVSGAYLGDKMSPMSDTTNLAPAVAEADLFDHIKSMMYTTGPAFLITLVVYGLLGLQYNASSVDSEMMTMMTEAIQENFHMNILLLLPAVAVIVMAICKCPSIPTLMVSSLAAVALAMLVQGQTLSGILNILDSGFSIDTALPEFNRLVNRGGLQSMLWQAAARKH